MKSLAVVLASIVSMFICACGSGGSNSSAPASEPSTRIYEGEELNPVTTPQVVQLVMRDAQGQEAYCSGTVIGSASVLTATHCFLIPNLSEVYVSVAGSLVPAASLDVHPGFVFDGTALFFDVAVVTTASALGVPAVPILASVPVSSGDSLYIYGYGFDENYALGTLRAGTISPDVITENHIIDYVSAGQNTCKGDSGGPVVAMYDLNGTSIGGIVGITSSGTSEDCTNQDTSYYINLQNTSILSFIASVAPDAVVH